MPIHVKRRFAAVAALVVIAGIHLFAATVVVAEQNASSIAEHSDILMKVLGGLLSVNILVLTGFVGWLVSNQKELFQRIGTAETRIETLKAVCAERHD